MRTYGPKRITVNEQAKNVMPLSESSLNRMMDHGKTGMIIISSQVTSIEREDPNLDLTAKFEKSLEKKGGVQAIDSDAMYDEMQDWLRRRNKAADKQLRQDIQDAGFSYTPNYGGYRMQETGEETFEPSYIVYCYDAKGQPRDFQDLLDFGLKMCLKYSQESIYVKAPGKPPVYLDYNGNQTNTTSTDNFRFNGDDEEYFSKIKRKKARSPQFTADINFNEMYVPLRPGDYNENMRRRKSGEYIL